MERAGGGQCERREKILQHIIALKSSDGPDEDTPTSCANGGSLERSFYGRRKPSRFSCHAVTYCSSCGIPIAGKIDYHLANYTARQRIISDVMWRLRKLDINERVDVLQLREE